MIARKPFPAAQMVATVVMDVNAADELSADFTVFLSGNGNRTKIKQPQKVF